MRICIVLFLFCASVQSQVTNERESRTVLIKSGPVRGYKTHRRDVFEFHGIPYAKAPTGAQRFKAPLPAPLWYETFEAVDKGIVCPQIFVTEDISESPVMKEDCLIANIFVPKVKENNLPVVVYVHGGAFIAGYGNLIIPTPFVNGRNIIAVTFNYRLGAHGFLCLGTEDVPGNAGMKDQIALLRWVKKNIASFGGNPDDVTISGYSAGSIAVDLLMISKMAEGLFHKVIPESGSSLTPMSIQIDPIQSAKEYANLIGNHYEDDLYEVEYFFKSAPYEILQSGIVLYEKNSSAVFSPCIERDVGQEIFLEDNPINILRKGNFSKLPILYGFADMEGSVRIAIFDFWSKDMNENFVDFIPSDLHFKSKEEKDVVAHKIRQFYFGDRPIDNNSVLEYIEYFSQVLFVCPTLRVINYLLKAGHDQIYLYIYSYTDEDTPIIQHTNVRGASHCDQTTTVVGQYKENIYLKPKVTKDYETMQSITRELWMNFIKNGKPEASGVPTWPPIENNWSPHMILKKDPELGSSLLAERCLFWDELYDSYYKYPKPPLTPLLKSLWFDGSYKKKFIVRCQLATQSLYENISHILPALHSARRCDSTKRFSSKKQGIRTATLDFVQKALRHLGNPDLCLTIN